MLDKKTNGDFNNEHPDHNEAGLVKGSPIPAMNHMEIKRKQTMTKDIPETKLKKRKQ